MAMHDIIGALNFNLKFPGKVILNDVTVADDLSISYAEDRLRFTFTPIRSDGVSVSPITTVNRINYQKGKIGIIGIDTSSNVGYTMSYNVLAKKLTISVDDKTSTVSVRSIADAIATIVKVILRMRSIKTI